MREKRKTALRRRLMMICLILILACLCILILPFRQFVVAAEEKSGDIHYMTYVVQSGDTLWGIADHYISENFDSHQAYINEVIRANGMNSSRIYDGQLIIIPYEAEQEADYTTASADEQPE